MKGLRMEYLGRAATVLFAVLIALAFSGSALQQRFLGQSYVAAVVASVLVDLANHDRAAEGREVLSVNPALVAAAQTKANDMAAKGYFAHVSPEGIDPWHWFAKTGYAFDYAGENLAVDFSDSGDVERAWMASPSHRANILDPRFTEIGVAIAQGMYQGRPTTFVVQEFGTPNKRNTRPVATAHVPEVREDTAVAPPKKPEPPARVLGTAKQEPPAVASKPAEPAIPEASSSSSYGSYGAVATTEPAVAAALSQKEPPLWRYGFGFPRQTLRFALYLIAGLVLLALAFETGLEIRWHHRRHALRAGILLASMTALFFLADAWFFAQPVLASSALL